MAISTNGTVLARLAGALYNTQMSNATYSEVKTLDPATLADALYARDFSASTDAAVATTLVTNLGLASVTGLNNWVAAQLTAAGSHKGAKIVDLLNSFAQMTADTTYGSYATAFNTKVDAALALSQTTDNAGGTFGAAAPAPVGATFALTSSVDNFGPNLAAAASKTTAGDDLFRATTNGEFASSDIIDGGNGNDTVKAVLTADNQTLKPLLTSVESVEVALTSFDTKDVTFDFSDAASVTSFKLTAADTSADDTEVTIKGVATTDAVNLSTSYAGANTLTSATITYSSVTGTADSATFAAGGNITNITAAGIESATVNTTAFKGTLTLAAATTVTINSGSSASKTTDVADIAQSTAKLATLNLGGSGESLIVGSGTAINFKGDGVVNITNTGKTTLTLDNLAAATDSLTVTGGEGKDYVNIAAVAQGATISVETGNGDDQVTIDGEDVTVNTGAGNDRLVADLSKIDSKDSIALGAGDLDAVVTSDTTLNASDKAALALVSGAEVVETSAAGAIAIDANAVSVVSNFTVAAAMAAAPNSTGNGSVSVTLTGTENTDKFVISADRAGETAKSGGAFNGAVALSAAPKLDNGSNILNLELVGGLTDTDGVDLAGGTKNSGTGADAGAISASNIETLNINLVDKDADEVATTVAAHTFVGAGTADEVTVGTNATVNVTGAGELTMGVVKGTNVTVDASSLTGKISVTAGDGNVTLKGGSGADSLTGGNGTDVLNGGAGADTIDGGAGVDEMTGGAGKDTFTVAIGGTTAVTAVTDKVTDFEVGSDKIDLTTTTAVANKASTDVSGAIGGAGAVAGDTLTASVANGVITLSGNAVAKIDTVAELIDIFELMDVTGTADSAVIELAGSTYVISDESGNAVIEVVQLVGLTGVTKIGTTIEAGILALS